VVDRSVLAEVTGFNLHRGVIAAANRPAPRSPDEVLAGATTVAVLQGLNDSENLGAVFRNAAAFGVDAVLLDPRTADPLYRRVVRVSMGHVLAVPFARIDDLTALDGFELVALTPATDAEPIAALDRAGRVALLLGAEGPGLTDDWLRRADRRIRIPLAADVDSLNVATAAAIAFHHRFG
jgi:tRNA G18 (ribose-2'-O)-methylase SpoU